jgi:hypothetical protein
MGTSIPVTEKAYQLQEQQLQPQEQLCQLLEGNISYKDSSLATGTVHQLQQQLHQL